MRPKMDLNALRVFVEVAKHGSFSGAAKAQGMPTSNVSRQVQQLEERLNLRLIERTTRHLKLTEAGQLLYTRMGSMLDALTDAEVALSLQQNQLTGQLRLCVPNEIGPALFAKALAEFAVMHPLLEISCTTNLSGEEVLKQDIDLAVIISRGKMADSSIIALPLLTFPCCVVAAPQLLQKVGHPTRIAQLKQLPCITTVSALNGEAWQFMMSGGRFKKVAVKAHYRVNSGEMAFQAAVAGLGFAILAKQACARYLQEGKLVEVALEHQAAPLALSIVYSGQNYLPARVKALIEFLRQYAGDLKGNFSIGEE
ncbi:D-malate degradation protein R [Cedecea davisae]|uniref:LysR substrate binding domain protein n=1 Tax=Cedecea davisae DSM 4568 TaxID=566551 RepID=S3JG75_9ENTR|nr:LysR family transcriptional regulator [Cedecea davisae]EPF19192.1 LysR substrate binding domain protein [Cedecea davisae DSM 4568]SUX29062.1 D-malate degradation protein R [Cedecea davisae]